MKMKNSIRMKTGILIAAALSFLCAAPEPVLSQILKAESVYPTLGETEKSLNATVKGAGFDQNTTTIFMYLDIGNTKAVIGYADTPGGAVGITVSDSVAYVADGFGGLQIVNVSNPVNPRIIGSADTPGNAEDVFVSDGKAYIADGESGLQVVDVTDPANPKIIGSADTPGNAEDVFVSDGKAYIADGESGLQVIDISDQKNPKIIGFVNTPSNEASGVVVSDGKAFIADRESGLQIIDISDPKNPKIISSANTPGRAEDVFVTGGKAYVADNGSGLQIIDISDPENPEIIGSVTTSGYAFGVFVSDEKAYLTDMSGIQAIDINDPANPEIIGFADTPGKAFGLYVAEGIAYIADEYEGGLQIVSTDALSKPQNIPSVKIPNQAEGVFVADGKAYAATLGGLQVIDIVNPLKPEIIGSVNTFAQDIYITEGKAYIADLFSGLHIIDIADPSNPEIIASLDTPGTASGVFAAGRMAYIADGESGLQIVDISDLSDLRIIGSADTPGKAEDVFVADGKAYVADWEGGLQIIDVADSSHPKIIASVDENHGYDFLENYVYDVFVTDGKAYIADSLGLGIINISDPSNPKVISSVDTPGVPLGVYVAGKKAYIADGYSGLQVIDISDPAKPKIIASIYTPSVESVFAADGRAYVAGDDFFIIPDPVEITPIVKSDTEMTLTLPGQKIPGNYTLKVFNSTESYELRGAVTFAPPGESQYIPKGQTLDEALRSKAIIVSGGGPGSVPDIWKETKLCADAAYRAMRWRGYTDDDIYYLTSESDQNFPTDGIPSKSRLQYAVSTWANEGDAPSELLLYLVDHGGDGIFKVAPGEEVTVGELDGWLDSLQNTMPGPVIFIYDACKSGTFLAGSDGLPRFAPPTGKERIAITGSSDEDAYFLYNGRLSFSYMFWQAVEDGEKLNQAFSFGRDMIGKQTPLLDANGNGKANEADDRSRAGRGLRRQYVKDSIKPLVENLSDSRKTLNGETSLNLKVRVTSENEITKVWAVIAPPDYSSEESSAVTELPVAELQDTDKDGIYETNYTNLGAAGTYIFTIYASDVNDYISLPAQMLVTQSKGNAVSKADSSEQSGDDTPGGAVPAVVNGGPVYHNFHESGDTDYVKFYVLSGKTYQIKITSPSMNCNVSIEIYDTDGLSLLAGPKDDGGAGEDEFLEWTCPGKGLYYARIGNADPDVFGANTDYRLEVRTPTGPDTGKILLSFTDSVSGNPVGNARASFGDYSCVSGSDGNCEIIPQIGTYPLLADAEGYESFSPLSVTVDKGADNIVEKDIVLTPGKEMISLKGNVDGDGSVNLRDAILALQLSAGKTISKPLNIQSDVNADGRIGIPESLYILHKLLH